VIVIRRAGIVLVLLSVAVAAHAIVRRHDRDDARYLAFARDVHGVVDMNLPGGAGTLIAPDWVLTAAHVVQLIKLPHDVIVDGERIAIRAIVAYPGGGVGRDDIALVQLERAVETSAPVPLDDGSVREGMTIGCAARCARSRRHQRTGGQWRSCADRGRRPARHRRRQLRTRRSRHGTRGRLRSRRVLRSRGVVCGLDPQDDSRTLDQGRGFAVRCSLIGLRRSQSPLFDSGLRKRVA